MATERLDTAMKTFQQTTQMVERYTRLCRAYVNLAERFHQLDVDHMTLKGQVVPLLKAIKAKQVRLGQLEAENAQLHHRLRQQADQHQQAQQALRESYNQQIQALTHRLDDFKPLEQLFTPEVCQELAVAEEQLELVEATFDEMAQDGDPDLSTEEKALLAAYRADPSAFLAATTPAPWSAPSLEPIPEAS